MGERANRIIVAVYDRGYSHCLADTKIRYEELRKAAGKVLDRHGLEPGHQEGDWFACGCEDCGRLRVILGEEV